MHTHFIETIEKQLEELKIAGQYKEERLISSPQSAHITIDQNGQREVLNFCANNYLGLANDPRIVESAKQAYDTYGFGLASVRFICGTQTIHKTLELRLSKFLGTEDTILYSSCFDANGGLFETLFSAEDVIISDALNHASIIDGIRLSKAQRLRYQNNDMNDLELQLQQAGQARFKVIATDGVFSMDGTIANLKAICDLADRYQTLVMIDDCHAVGFMGKKGRGTIEFCNVMGRIDLITGTLGKALGGASGGYVSGKKSVIDWLRQRSRPYLFSNTLSPSIAGASITALDLLEESDDLRVRLHENSRYFRAKMLELGFELPAGEHPIIPIMLGDARLAQTFALKMLEHRIYVVGFCYPVVPIGKARIRTQMSAAHSIEDIDKAIDAFAIVGRELHVIS